VGQRKIWGIVNLAKRYPNHLVDAACAQALEHGVHSYGHVKAVTERLVADALAALQPTAMAAQAESALTQQHDLIRSSQEYGDLFAHAATACTPSTTSIQDQIQQGQQP
jgi:hypothetical protein